jgi:hypothetical protein
MPEHQHAGFEMPAGYIDPEARPVDHELLGRFVGAAFDGCAPSQDALLARMAQDPVTTARLVELACVATLGALGGLPASLTQDDVPGLAGPEFRRLARAGLDGANAELFRACEQMTAAERRAAADSAADLLVGLLATGGPKP